MTWNVELTKPAYKQLKTIAKKDRLHIAAALQDMERDPYSGDIKWIDKREGVLRRRVGNWRIFFAVLKETGYVPVLAIERRKSKTYS